MTNAAVATNRTSAVCASGVPADFRSRPLVGVHHARRYFSGHQRPYKPVVKPYVIKNSQPMNIRHSFKPCLPKPKNKFRSREVQKRTLGISIVTSEA
jgi:hypothetical protein